jgi:hypothetical protein
MSQFVRGELVRLKFNGDVFEVVVTLTNGMIKVSSPQLQLIVSPEMIEPIEHELDKLPLNVPNSG